MMTRTALAASLALGVALVAGGYAVAQMDHSSHGHSHGHSNGHSNGHSPDHSHGHSDHATPSQPRPDLPASTAAYMAANDAMHADMMIEFTGDADVDFIAGMIPHHEGAIVMAEIVLEHGQDPEVAELARAIIAAQAEEIAWMRAWLAARGQ